jgi:mRNA-degrading endonuclease RelE of RelBE toxin-antitoxin system
MEKFNLEKELREIGVSKRMELPDELRARQDAVYASLLEMPTSSRSKVRNERGYLRKFSIVTAIAATLTLIVGISSAMISPVMASTLKEMPIIGGVFRFVEDMGLQFAEENGLTNEVNLSQTHDGITLHVPQVIYDGIRLSVAVQREENNYSGGIFDREVVGTGFDTKHIYQKGAINRFNILINGKSTFESAKLSLFGMRTNDPDLAIFQVAEDTRTQKRQLPDEFTLTLILGVEGAKTPFTFELPVRKQTEQLTYPLSVTKQSADYKLEMTTIQFTPMTTKVKLNIVLENGIKNRIKDYKLLYELWDDKGARLQHFSGGIARMGDQGVITQELLFDRFEEIPQEIILKPFLPELVDPSKESGKFKEDANGEIVKHYLKELEIRIPVESEELERLYKSIN